MNDHKQSIIHDLVSHNIIEYGEFILKSGEKSNIYIDLRKLTSYPKILKSICRLLNKEINDVNNTSYSSLLGVPTGGYSFAQGCSILSNIPCIFLRKETKNHGKKKLLEGIWKEGDSVILIEDVITSGTSLLETIEVLETLNIHITKIFVVLKRSDQGISKIQKKGIPIDYLFTLEELQSYEDNITKIKSQEQPKEKMNLYSYALLDIMKQKKSNIILSIDMPSTYKILHLAEIAGPHVCGIKVHLDIIPDISQQFLKQLKELSIKYHFLIIEDRKFADIGNTVELQLCNPQFNMREYINAVTVHTLPGSDMLNVFRKYSIPVILIQEMSTKNNLFNNEYIRQTIEIANSNADIVLGVVGQRKRLNSTLLFTPGIHLDEKGDSLGQNYNTPEKAKSRGTDIFIIGRGIYKASNPLKELLKYKELCWTNN